MREQLPDKWSKFIMKDVSFVNLMMRRIYNVLIVANPYDAFMLEDDGRVEEKIYNEYTRLGLRYPPTFTQVSTIEEAEKILSTVSIDGSYNIVVFLTICISYANNCFTL